MQRLRPAWILGTCNGPVKDCDSVGTAEFPISRAFLARDRVWHMLTPVAVLQGNQFAYRDTLAFDMLPEGWEPAQ